MDDSSLKGIPAAAATHDDAYASGLGSGSLPKAAHLIRAEMGIQIGRHGGARDVISVSLADDLEAVATEWCAARGVSAKAKAKVVLQLQSRLDSALALAWQDKEERELAAARGGHQAAAPPSDVC